MEIAHQNASPDTSGLDRAEGAAGELTPLGKRIEMLRIERGISKQQLARAAGVSRQQLWRVLAGKSELTTSLCERIAAALRTEGTALRVGLDGGASGGDTTAVMGAFHFVLAGSGAVPHPAPPRNEAPADFAAFVANPDQVRAALRALPGCESGTALRRALLDAIEVHAMAHAVPLGPAFFELRHAVVARLL